MTKKRFLNTCVKKMLFIFLLCLVICLQFGCEKKDYEKQGITAVYYQNVNNRKILIDSNEELLITDFCEKTKKISIYYNWWYVVEHVTLEKDVPLIETLHPNAYMYRDEELIYSSNSFIREEFEELEYGITHNFWDSTISYGNNYRWFTYIDGIGTYKIVVKTSYKINGELKESNDTFAFVIK